MPVIVHDDDEAGIAVVPDSLEVGEPDGTAVLTLTLTSEPTAAVEVTLGVSTTECAVWPLAVTLDALNWRTGASATVTAVDDDIVDGDQACGVETGPASSADANYDGLDPADVPVIVHDDDHGSSRVYLPLIVRRWPPRPDVPLLHPIQNLDGDGTYLVSWTAADLADLYILEEARYGLTVIWTEVYVGPATELAIQGRGATDYSYRVKARNDWGDSAWSNVESARVVWEAEPNDTPTQSNGLILPDVDYQGVFLTTSDVSDYFYFELAATRHVELWLTGIPSGQDYNLVLRDVYLARRGYSAEPGTAPEHIPSTILSAGIYYIQVFHFSGEGSENPYHLQVTW